MHGVPPGPGLESYGRQRDRQFGCDHDDEVSSSIRFSNIHYFAAAASQFGTVIDGGYEYEGKTYDARFSHVDGYNDCDTCHNPHTLQIREHNCATCHSFTDPKDIRYLGSCTDYDGDGDAGEDIYYEITTMADSSITPSPVFAYGHTPAHRLRFPHLSLFVQ